MPEQSGANAASVAGHLAAIADDARRADCERLVEMMRAASNEEPKMWGGVVGFGSYHYRYASGREGDTFVLGFASRKDAITLYLGPALDEQTEALRSLGKHRAGKGCLYVRRLADLDLDVLAALLRAATTRRYGTAAP